MVKIIFNEMRTELMNRSISKAVCTILIVLAIIGSGMLISNQTFAMPVEILYQDDFEDGNLTIADTQLTKGMTWSTHGDSVTQTNKSLESKIFRMNSGAYALSNEAINQSEYTVSFTSINWYNTTATTIFHCIPTARLLIRGKS